MFRSALSLLSRFIIFSSVIVLFILFSSSNSYAAVPSRYGGSITDDEEIVVSVSDSEISTGSPGSGGNSSRPIASAPLCGPGSLNPNSEYCYGGKHICQFEPIKPRLDIAKHNYNAVDREALYVESYNRIGAERYEKYCSGNAENANGIVAAEDVPKFVSLSAFETFIVEPPNTLIGPPSGYIPFGLEVVAYAEADDQVFVTEILGHEVTVRVVAVSFEWHFGDGTVLTSSFPGRPFPERDVSMRYRGEGWYEAFLLTTYVGEVSVDGGVFTPISGSVVKESGRTWLYSDVRSARLVGADGVGSGLSEVPVRGVDSLGPVNPDAEVGVLKKPRSKKWWEKNG